MTICAVRTEAERRSAATVKRTEVLVDALTCAAPSASGACAVCGRTTELTTVFVIPVTYIAACLVQHDLDVF